MKYFETHSTNPYYNLAFEEYILRNEKNDDCLILWQNDNAVIVGMHQNAYEEVNLAEAKRLGISVVRRITGGGTVYHDLGNLNFSYITDFFDAENTDYKRFLNPIISALGETGLEVELKGRNDLIVADKKISGSAQAVIGDRILHHGTLLINTNLDVMDFIFNTFTGKMQSKGVKSVRSRVTNIQDHISNPIGVDDVKNIIFEYYRREKDLKYKELTEEALNDIRELEITKYQDWNWNYGRSPEFSFKNEKRFSGGSVEINLEIDEGIIGKCMINGDFLSLKDIGYVEESIIGTKYAKEQVYEVLHKLPTKIYFGNILVEELVSCFFVD